MDFPGSKKIKQEEIENIIYSYENRILNSTELGKKYGVSKATILKLLRNFGVEIFSKNRRKPRKNVTAKRKRIAVKILYDLGKTQQEIADFLGYSDRYHVSVILRKKF